MAYENPIEDDLPPAQGRGLAILVGVMLLGAFAAYLAGYLPQFDVLFAGAHSSYLAHNDQIGNYLANGLPFVAAGLALVAMIVMLRRVAAQRHA